jgi:integrase
MNRMEPIKDGKKIEDMTIYLRGHNTSGRDALMFIMGIRVGLRISDLLSLKYETIFQDSGKFKEFVVIEEQKTKKIRKIKLPDQVKREITQYVKKQNLRIGDYLFYPKDNRNKAIGRTIAWDIFSQAAAAVGIENFGTHSLRKTFGFWYYNATKDIGGLMRIFNHSSQDVTLRYIGIDQETINVIYQEVSDIFEKEGNRK